MRRKTWAWVLTAMLATAIAATLAFNLSPRPMIAVVAWLFDRGAESTARALERHVPAGGTSRLDLPVGERWPGLAFDLHLPGAAPPSGGWPVLVWIHGGGWVSGHKGDVAHYLRIVASRGGLATASLDYTLAPDATHPVQLQQVHAGLVAIRARAAELGIDPDRVLLAGDSAGAQLAAQLATAITDPGYAERLGVAPGAVPPSALRGVALFCGPYDLRMFQLDGALGPVLRATLWGFTGQRDLENNPAIDLASVLNHVTPAFPPAFITVGNADPLKPHSLALEARLRALGVAVDTLYFPDDRTPALGHEYQFNLDDPAGGQALQRLLDFVDRQAR